MKSFQDSITQEEFNFLKTGCGNLYALSDGEAFFAGGGEAPCGAGASPLQTFDLNGINTLLGIDGLLDGQLRCLDGGLIPCALMPDYWTRTVGGGIREIPQVKAELDRIWDDYAFVLSGPTWGAMAQRVEGYKTLDIFSA